MEHAGTEAAGPKADHLFAGLHRPICRHSYFPFRRFELAATAILLAYFNLSRYSVLVCSCVVLLRAFELSPEKPAVLIAGWGVCLLRQSIRQSI